MHSSYVLHIGIKLQRSGLFCISKELQYEALQWLPALVNRDCSLISTIACSIWSNERVSATRHPLTLAIIWLVETIEIFRVDEIMM